MEQNYDRLIEISLDIGIGILQAGGRVSRVEDTIHRILSAYGLQKIGVFNIPSLIEVNAQTPDGKSLVRLRRIQNNGAIHLIALEKWNALSRWICAECPETEKIDRRLRALQSELQKPMVGQYQGNILVAIGFTLFFGGTLMDIPAVIPLACMISFLDAKGLYKNQNRLLFYFLCSFFTGLLGWFLVRFGIGQNLDQILIGCIMITIPGIAITYAALDMLLGDTITGLLSLAESLLTAASIAAGFLLSLKAGAFL
uniref:threonine/serine ThrE exporter family protein n=1 Tax=Ndongobacter massiliensis TaxID=1871025 RepID=UPI0009302E48|nr:threonine/serine exporter family protein [Ndongobacter massiliensis]